MTYKPKGSYSAMTFDAIRRAELLQSRVMKNIHTKFQTERPAKDITEITWEKFIEDLEEAYASGTIDELNARYAAILEPLIQQALTAPPQEGGQPSVG